MDNPTVFDFYEAFSRTLGWVTEAELQVLRHKRVAIAGAGGVGGLHLLTLTRLGIGAFHVADLDTFEQANFNRQAGAMMSTLGKAKVDVMAGMALDINPELDLRLFPAGVGEGNADDFLEGADLYVDALDFFAFEARIAVFAACARRGIPAITVAPLGMGAALINFLPGGMTFEDYFGFQGRPQLDRIVRFMVGLAPRAPHRRYLVDPHRMDLAHQRGPSTPMGVQLCAGVAGSEALKILLGRGGVLGAPHARTFDAYLNGYVHTWRPGGHRHPLNRLSIWLGNRFLAKAPAASQTSLAPPEGTLARILDEARWAPSGDNEQPWRFQVLSEHHVDVHYPGTAPDDLYNFDGRPALISLGCLAESLRLAASRFGWEMHWHYETHLQGGVLKVGFNPSGAPAKDPLCDFLRTRSVDRRHYLRRPLTPYQKMELEASLGPGFRVAWLESPALRWRASRVNAATGQLRLSIPETIGLHQRVIDWSNRFSPDRIPAQALGATPWGLLMMRWVMANARRARLALCGLPGGTLCEQVEMEWLPGLCSAAHFMVIQEGDPEEDRDASTLRAGMAVQRFWLTATRLGLALQPSVAALAFAYYGREGIPFSGVPSSLPRARKLADRFSRLCGEGRIQPEKVEFLGRIGVPVTASRPSRSMRRPLSSLELGPDPQASGPFA